MHMITVENLLETLFTLVQAGAERDAWKTNFISNVHMSVAGGRALSTAQAKVVLKLAAQHISGIAKARKIKVADIQSAISSPVYSKPLVQSQNIPREVRYVGDGAIAFRFKLDEIVVRDIKALKGSNGIKPFFHRQYRIWVAPVTANNVDDVRSIIERHKFNYDHATLGFLAKVKDARKTLPSFKFDPNTDMLNVVVPNSPLLTTLLKASLKAKAQ